MIENDHQYYVTLTQMSKLVISLIGLLDNPTKPLLIFKAQVSGLESVIYELAEEARIYKQGGGNDALAYHRKSSSKS